MTAVPPPSSRGRTFGTVLFVALVLAALLGQAGSRAQTPNSLPYSRGYLITGNYVVGGVDLPRGGGTGTINFNTALRNTVPLGAEVIAAWAIWETVEPVENTRFSGARFRDQPIDAAKVSRVASLPGAGANCWGTSGGSSSFLTTYRTDVLPLLPKQYDKDNKWTGRYIVNDEDLARNGQPLHTITLPPVGTGNRTTTSAGASLLLVWRHPEAPLRKIVVYDGAAPQAQGDISTQTIAGFYRASSKLAANLTYIVGSGANNTGERLLFNGSVIATNPFPAPIDAGSDRGWANPTFDVQKEMAQRTFSDANFGQYVTTTIDHGSRNQNTTPYECLSVAAVIFSTTVADDDGDGLPDALEESDQVLRDPGTPAYPTGQPLPNLYAMGARLGQKDLFVEINAMWARGRDGERPGTTYGSAAAPFNATRASIEDIHGHDHMPSFEVLKMVGDAYARVGYPQIEEKDRVRVHFDVGNPNTFCGLNAACLASPYLIKTGARGGERIEERACENCQFGDFPGTVGWPYGFRLYRDAPVGKNGEELVDIAAMKAAAPENSKLRRRFDGVREPYFHYALFAHARGKTRPPCLDQRNSPVEYNGVNPDTGEAACVGGLVPNPQFPRVPTSASGVADLPGGNILVTLGLWDTEKFVGSPFVQASTFFHELGHNLNLWHGGDAAVFGDKAQNTSTWVEPNCKPTYQSSMSYLFQVHGLMDDTGALHLDYSGVKHNATDEIGLAESALTPAPKYRAAWFAPVGSALATTQGATAARRYCSGAPFGPTLPNPLMGRVVAGSTSQAIDWDGDSATQNAPLDVNFDGAVGELLGFDDWRNLRLNQISATRTARIFRTANGDLLDFGSGDLLDFGSGDLLDFGSGDLLDFGSGTHIVHLGSGDFFRYGSGDLLDFGSGGSFNFGLGDLLDFGSGVLMFTGGSTNPNHAAGDLLDFGSGDLLDFGSGDLLDFGSGDLLDFGSGDLLDFGSGDLLDFGSGDLLDFGSGTQELDFDSAFDLERPRPLGLTACVVGGTAAENGCSDTGAPGGSLHRIKLTWKHPTFGVPSAYEIYRTTGTTTPVLIWTLSAPAATVSPATTYTDPEELPNNVTFRYWVKAVYGARGSSPNSNEALIKAVNYVPQAVNDAYSTRMNTALTVTATNGVLKNDTDPDSPSTSRRLVVHTQPTVGTVTVAADGSFVYTPPNGFTGTTSFTYKPDNGTWPRDTNVPLNSADQQAQLTQGTVTITVARR